MRAFLIAAAIAGVLSVATAAAGAVVTISGSVPTAGAASCPSSDSVTLTSDAALFPPDGFGPQVQRDGTGAFSTAHAVPASTAAGTYRVGRRCAGGNVGVTATLQITARMPTPVGRSTLVTVATTRSTTTASQPSHKGRGRGWVIALALALVVVVAGAVLLSRRFKR